MKPSTAKLLPLSINELGAKASIMVDALRLEYPSTEVPATFCEVTKMPAWAIFSAALADSLIE